MPDKSFEHVIPFTQFQNQQGFPVWLPLVTVTVIHPNGQGVDLAMVFDTGASVTTLRHDLAPLLGLAAWDVGGEAAAGQSATAGGDAPALYYQYPGTIQFLGRTTACPINLMQLGPGPYMGLFGRQQVFDQFGFGFWESAREIYVTMTP
jgi:hypothetical protein